MSASFTTCQLFQYSNRERSELIYLQAASTAARRLPGGVPEITRRLKLPGDIKLEICLTTRWKQDSKIVLSKDFEGNFYLSKGFIKIKRDVCKGCGLCISACPKGCIRASKRLNIKGYYPAEYVEDGKGNAHECTGCALCAIMCPDVAIEVFRG